MVEVLRVWHSEKYLYLNRFQLNFREKSTDIKNYSILCLNIYTQAPGLLGLTQEYLDKALKTEPFQQAVKMNILESRFFPTAKELVEAIKSDNVKCKPSSLPT